MNLERSESERFWFKVGTSLEQFIVIIGCSASVAEVQAQGPRAAEAPSTLPTEEAGHCNVAVQALEWDAQSFSVRGAFRSFTRVNRAICYENPCLFQGPGITWRRNPHCWRWVLSWLVLIATNQIKLWHCDTVCVPLWSHSETLAQVSFSASLSATSTQKRNFKQNFWQTFLNKH